MASNLQIYLLLLELKVYTIKHTRWIFIKSGLELDLTNFQGGNGLHLLQPHWSPCESLNCCYSSSSLLLIVPQITLQ